VNKIMTRLTEGIDMKQYMDLYTSVHNFCTSQKGLSQSVNLATTNKERGGKQRDHHGQAKESLFLLFHTDAGK